MTRFNRILSLLVMLTVPIFLVACEGEGYEEEGELGTETEGLEQTPTQPGTMGETGTFTSWDTDADAGLSEDEFSSGLRQGNHWTDWDADANQSLNQDEFNNAFGESEWYEEGLFGEWDADGNSELTEDEWQSGLFDRWDADNDNLVREGDFDNELFAGQN